MENKDRRHADNHPAIQNLRRFLKEYLGNDVRHTLASFAKSLGKTPNELGRYIRGECTPRRKLIEEWAASFGVEYEDMMIAEFPHIDYPFELKSSAKKSGGHITKRQIRKNFEEMYDEVSAFVGENDASEYGKGILEILKRHEI